MCQWNAAWRPCAGAVWIRKLSPASRAFLRLAQVEAQHPRQILQVGRLHVFKCDRGAWAQSRFRRESARVGLNHQKPVGSVTRRTPPADPCRPVAVDAALFDRSTLGAVSFSFTRLESRATRSAARAGARERRPRLPVILEKRMYAALSFFRSSTRARNPRTSSTAFVMWRASPCDREFDDHFMRADAGHLIEHAVPVARQHPFEPSAGNCSGSRAATPG